MERKFAILVVDDDAGLTTNLQDLLEAEGYHIGVAQDGQEALALCRKGVFDLALIDIKLPDISGIKLIEKLAKLSPLMEYIISTGYASLETAVEVVGWRHIVAYETKPLDIDHLLALVRQVSERKQAENALKKSEVFTSVIFDSITDLITVQDTEYNVIRVNHVVEQIFGKDVVGKKCYQAYQERDGLCPDCPTAKVLVSGEPAFSSAQESQTGPMVEIQAFPIKDEHGSITAVIEHGRDITERKKMQIQLIQMEKLSAVGTMAAGVAHELLNPMMGILNFAQYCRGRTAKDDRRYAILQDIERETERCSDIVKSLLTFYRMGERGEEEYQRESFATIIDRVVRLLSYRISTQGVSLTQHITEGTPEVWMEASGMQQVLLNLVTNALDAVEESEKKEVRIDVRGDGKLVQVTIADSGCGIPPENQGKIFTPFFTTKIVGQGTGLGLALSQNIILKHGGDITCQSNLGVGTTFKVLLPVEKTGGVE